MPHRDLSPLDFAVEPQRCQLAPGQCEALLVGEVIHMLRHHLEHLLPILLRDPRGELRVRHDVEDVLRFGFGFEDLFQPFRLAWS